MKRGLIFTLVALVALLVTSCFGKGSNMEGRWSANFEGTLKSYDKSDVELYTKEEYRVTVVYYYASQTIQVTFNEFRPTEGAEPQTLVFSNIPCVITMPADGLCYNIINATATPTINNTPAEEYAVEGLNASIGNSNVTIRFTMTEQPYKVEFNTNPKQ